MGIQQWGGDLLAPVAAVRRFYQTMSTRGWEGRTPKVEREIRGVKFALSSIPRQSRSPNCFSRALRGWPASTSYFCPFL